MELLTGTESPTAIIGCNDIVALGVMDAAIEYGLTPGKDLAVIGYDDIPEASEGSTGLTTVSAPAERLGNVAANAFLNLRKHGHGDEVINLTNPPKLIVRESCGAQSPTA